MIRFTDLLDGEAYIKSHYMYHEHLTMEFFISQLLNLGYTAQDNSLRIWKKGNTDVIVCLTDDAYTFGTDLTTPRDVVLTKDTIVITDNSFLGIPKFKIIKLPDSYFGIYGYAPSIQDWQPSRRFNFSVNRFCKQRLLILLELVRQSGGVNNFLEQDYVNFNVYDPVTEATKIKDLRSIFTNVWDCVDPDFQEVFAPYIKQLTKEVPIRNHEFSHEQVHVNSWLNIVVETYAGDTNRTVSEKTFRALVTPVPWTLFACRHTVEMLKALGFDVLDDIVDHSYNKVLQTTSKEGMQKIQQFVTSSIENQRRFSEMDFNILKARCIKAAEHNQKLLAEMRKQWPKDFSNWLPGVIDQLA